MTRRMIFWIGLAFALCWVPSGWLTGLEARLIPATRGQSQVALFWYDATEPLAHGLLMFGLGFSLMRLLSTRRMTDGVDGDSGECDSDPPSATATDRPLPRVSEAKRPWFLNPWVRCASMTLLGVMVIAVLIELAQSFLPPSFHRGFSWGDLGASLAGGFIGILMGGGRAFVAQFLRSLSTRLQDQILDLSGGAVTDLRLPCFGR
jgi:hypothetical protein